MEELQELFRKISSTHLVQLLHEMDSEDRPKQQSLARELAYKTGFNKEIIRKSLEENIYREVARRWIEEIK